MPGGAPSRGTAAVIPSAIFAQIVAKPRGDRQECLVEISEQGTCFIGPVPSTNSKGRLDDVAERLNRDYDPALVKETG